jgi:hypothetical protein
MFHFSDFLLLVILPPFLCVGNVYVLPFFGSTRKQDHHLIAIFSKVDSVARPEIDHALIDSAPYAFHIRPIPQAKLRLSCAHLGSGLSIKTIELVGKRAISVLIQVLKNLDHAMW